MKGFRMQIVDISKESVEIKEAVANMNEIACAEAYIESSDYEYDLDKLPTYEEYAAFKTGYEFSDLITTMENINKLPYALDYETLRETLTRDEIDCYASVLVHCASLSKDRDLVDLLKEDGYYTSDREDIFEQMDFTYRRYGIDGFGSKIWELFQKHDCEDFLYSLLNAISTQIDLDAYYEAASILSKLYSKQEVTTKSFIA